MTNCPLCGAPVTEADRRESQQAETAPGSGVFLPVCRKCDDDLAGEA